MSEELRQLDAEFDEKFLAVKKGIEKLEKEKDKMQAWLKLDGNLKELDDLLKSYRLEIFEVDKGGRMPFEKKADQYEAEVKRLRQELTFKRPASDREQLFSGAAAAAAGGVGAGVGGRDVDAMTAGELLQEGKRLQATDIDLLRQSNQLLETETLPTAAATLERLQKDTEDLEKIGVDLATIDDNLTRSKKTLETFAKRVAADKVVWLFVLLIIGAIIFCIVWGVTHPNSIPFVDGFRNTTGLSVPGDPSLPSPTLLKLSGE